MKLRFILYLGACLMCIHNCYGQKYYHVWTYGYTVGMPTYPNLRCVMDFNKDPVETYPDSILINLGATNAAICDSNGQLILYTNGHFIADGNHQVIKNGEGLNPNKYLNPNYKNYDCPGCHTFIPFEHEKSTLFHIGLDDHLGFPFNLRYLYRSDIIQDSSGNGYGYEVINKNTVIADGAFELYNLVKHGNGTSYWLIQPILQKDSFNIYFVDADNVYLHHQQRIGPQYKDGNTCYAPALNSISPDGTKYVRFNNKCGLWLYSLDRCTGLLSQPREIPLPIKPIQPGASTQFSPNSRYLYYNSSTVVYQVDTEAEFLTSDTVAVYDGFVDKLPTYFLMMSLMPDGRIYMTSTNSVLSLHTINYPDSAGLACQVNQHSYPLAGLIAWGINRYPNVWLGPMECDTTSAITPFHPELLGVRVTPNPAGTEAQLIIDGAEGHPDPWPVRIVDVQGREVYRGLFPSWSWIHRVDVSNWASGVYYFQVSDGHAVVATGSMIVGR